VSESEYLEIMIMAKDSMGFHAMNYIGVMFAYVVAAYLVGKKLSHFQFVALTFLYALFTPFPCFAAYESMTLYQEVSMEYYAKYRADEAVSVNLLNGGYALILLFAGTWLVSVAFMLQARRSK
jgi:hypothetical protein